MGHNKVLIRIHERYLQIILKFENGLWMMDYFRLPFIIFGEKVENSLRDLGRLKEVVILTRLPPKRCDLKSQIRHGPHRKCENVS